MRGEILTADRDGLARWTEFLADNPETGLFCQPAWLRFLAEAYGFPVRLAVCLEGSRILAGLPLVETNSLLFGRRLSNNPFSLYGELPAQSPAATAMVAQAAVDLAKKRGVGSLALRVSSPLPEGIVGLSARQNRIVPLLRLTGSYDDVFQGYKKQFRTNLRKARQRAADDGYIRKISTDETGYRRFYPVLLRLFRDKHAMFPAPLSHFLMLSRLLGPEHARLYSLSRQGETVAGMVILRQGKTAYYAWSAALQGPREMDSSAFLLDQVVQDLCSQGVSVLDMGVTSPSNAELLFFKERLGPEMTHPWHYHFSPSGAPLRDMSAETSLKGLRAALKFLPLKLFDALGRTLYRHMA